MISWDIWEKIDKCNYKKKAELIPSFTGGIAGGQQTRQQEMGCPRVSAGGKWRERTPAATAVCVEAGRRPVLWQEDVARLPEPVIVQRQRFRVCAEVSDSWWAWQGGHASTREEYQQAQQTGSSGPAYAGLSSPSKSTSVHHVFLVFVRRLLLTYTALLCSLRYRHRSGTTGTALLPYDPELYLLWDCSCAKI